MMPSPKLLPFEVKLECPQREVSEVFFWFHPRATAMPGFGKGGKPAVLMTIQQELRADDFYSGLYAMRTDDLGATWTRPTAIESLAWRREPGGVVISVADVTPGWHGPTKRAIAIGAEVRYSPGGAQLEDVKRSQQTAYAVFDPQSNQWSSWFRLEMPTEDLFDFSRNACSQWLVEDDGSLLIAFYHCRSGAEPFNVTVFRCGFDGKKITLRDRGNTLSLPVVRGLCEPSLVKHGGRYFLTLRNDEKGYVSESSDGLNYSPILPWKFDDGTDLGSYNTQQHWVTHKGGLFLCYTRRGYNNDHIPRNRAPLFIAQVDPERLCVIRTTEKILIPERGMMLGNFGAAAITENEWWVTDSEYVNISAGHKPSPRGGDGSTFVARVIF
jgi:hypothetical protein